MSLDRKHSTYKIKIIFRIFIISTLLMTVFIFSNSLTSAVESKETSRGVLIFIQDLFSELGINIALTQKIVRKSAHIIEYFILGILFFCIYKVLSYITQKSSKYAYLISGIAILIPIIDENLQRFSPGRSCEIRDMLIDMAGISTGILVSMAAAFFYKHKLK